MQNGFTAAGPIYIINAIYVDLCVTWKIPIIITLNLRHFVNFSTNNFAPINKTQIKSEVQNQILKALELNPIIFGWYILPEELRSWRKNEMDFLKTVSGT